MYSETLRNQAIVKSIGTEDKEESDKTIKEPEEDNTVDNTSYEPSNTTETPGFETIVFMLAILFILFLKKKKTS
jgi:hypothetical protein